MTELRLVQQTPDAENLKQYGTVSIAFEVTTRFAVHHIENNPGDFPLIEEPVTLPYRKDYDAIDGEKPTCWPNHFDLSRWVLWTTFDGAQPVGGLLLAWNTLGVEMLEGRDDLAVIWDMRVRPNSRGCGVGHRLFRAAEDWAKAHGCHEIKVETQNINVAACRFYARQGCKLRTVRQNAYPDLPDEAQFFWYKNL